MASQGMKIGFIGLGAMGRAMALNLLRAGHELQVYDLRRVEEFPAWKTSAGEAARGCEAVFTSLPGPHVGPIGAGTVAKLAHNCASFAVQAALAEIFTLGVKDMTLAMSMARERAVPMRIASAAFD